MNSWVPSRSCSSTSSSPAGSGLRVAGSRYAGGTTLSKEAAQDAGIATGPSTEVLDRYRAAGARLYRLDPLAGPDGRARHVRHLPSGRLPLDGGLPSACPAHPIRGLANNHRLRSQQQAPIGSSGARATVARPQVLPVGEAFERSRMRSMLDRTGRCRRHLTLIGEQPDHES